jgi:bacterioferritin
MKNIARYIKESGEYINDDIKQVLIDKLINALAEEIYAWYGYFIVCPFMSGNTQRKEIQEFYEKTADDELNDHAKWLIERINQLGGSTQKISSPACLATAKHPYEMPIFNNNKINIAESLKLNIKNELNAIDTYKDLVEYTAEFDPASNSKLKEILMDEEEHLNDLQEFLEDITGGDDTHEYVPARRNIAVAYDDEPEYWDDFDDPLLSM